MRKSLLSIPLLALGLSACSESAPLRAQLEAGVASAAMPERYISDRRETIQPLMILSSDPIRMRAISAPNQQPLPDKMVGPVDFTDVDIAFAIRSIAWEAGVTVRFDRDVGGETISFATSSQIPLDDAVKLITDAAGLDYSFDGRVLSIKQGGLYTLTVPNTGETFASVQTVIEALGGEIIASDERSSRLTIRADRGNAERIQAFMSNAGSSSDLIIFDAWLYEVSLTDRRNLGIDWEAGITGLLDERLGLTFKSPGTVADGFVGTIEVGSGNFDLSSFVSFLNTQGAVRSVSSPTLSMASGDEASFNISRNQVYIRNLRQVQNTTTEAGGNPTVETETAELNTGIEVKTRATFASGIVFADFDMNVSEFLSFEEFPSGDTTLKLPITTKRALNTSVQARPGDVIIMGGMISERENANDTGIAGLDLVTRRSGDRERAELVVLLRPRVVSFRPSR